MVKNKDLKDSITEDPTLTKWFGASQCKPCVFFRTPIGCNNGEACAFCHLDHKHPPLNRYPKTKRDRYRRIIEAFLDEQKEAQQTADSKLGLGDTIAFFGVPGYPVAQHNRPAASSKARLGDERALPHELELRAELLGLPGDRLDYVSI